MTKPKAGTLDETSITPQRTSTTRTTTNGQKRKNRRQYVLPKFDFEDKPAGDILGFKSTRDTDESNDNDECTYLQHRAIRFSGTQMLRPNVPVSPCVNATDRLGRSHILSQVSTSPAEDEDGVFCDVTDLLGSPRRKSCVRYRNEDERSILNDEDGLAERHGDRRGKILKDDEWAGDEIFDEDNIPDMLLSEDEVEEEYEVLLDRNGDWVGSEHNGTERRWYRGFRC
jgi:hypothetical protein